MTPRCSTRFDTARVAQVLAASTLVMMLVVHVVRSDLDPSWAPISTYALGDAGWMMTLTFVLWAASLIALAIACIAPAEKPAWAAAVLLALGGLGPLIAATFPTDPVGTLPEEMTPTGQIHGFGALLIDVIPIAAIILSAHLIRRHHLTPRARTYVLLTSALSWIGFVWVGIDLATHLPDNGGSIDETTPVGWSHRFMLASYLAWQIAVAAGLKVSADNTTTLGLRERTSL